MDFATKEIFKRYASTSSGRPISPVFLNILVTSVCDMRCTHCFLRGIDDRPRKKLQVKTTRFAKISETLGGNLGVRCLPAASRLREKDLPEMWCIYETQARLGLCECRTARSSANFPDVARIMDGVRNSTSALLPALTA